MAHVPYIYFLVGWQIARLLKPARRGTVTSGLESVALTSNYPVVTLQEHLCCLEDARRASSLPTKLLWLWVGNVCVPGCDALSVGVVGFFLPTLTWLASALS